MSEKRRFKKGDVVRVKQEFLDEPFPIGRFPENFEKDIVVDRYEGGTVRTPQGWGIHNADDVLELVG